VLVCIALSDSSVLSSRRWGQHGPRELPTCSNKMESLLPSCTWYNNNIHINNHWSNMIYVCAGIRSYIYTPIHMHGRRKDRKLGHHSTQQWSSKMLLSVFFFCVNRCCYLSSVYIFILLYFMAANSKVIYNTTKLFLCVCMHAATRRCWIPWVSSWTASKTTRWQSNHERYYVLLYTVIRLANLNLALLRNAVIIFTELVCFSYTYC